MYERHSQPPISRRAFLGRLAAHFGVVFVLFLGSLGVGVAGFALLEGMAWADAFLHASALLGGLGFVEAPGSVGGKLFAALYSLYAGLVFLAAFGIVLAPVVHRILHKFHWEADRPDSG